MGNVISFEKLRQRKLEPERNRREMHARAASVAWIEAVEHGAEAARRYRDSSGDRDTPTAEILGRANVIALRRKAARFQESQREFTDWLTANGLPIPPDPEIEIVYADDWLGA